MNLIWCNKSCIYQSEGLCTLEQITAPTAGTEEGCYYYVSKDGKTAGETPQTTG